MASLDDIVQLTVTIAGAGGLTKAGFGVPMVVAYHTHFTTAADLVRVYTKPADMITDGFATTDAAYKMVSALFAQNPHVTRVKVGRRTSAPTQTIDYTPSVTTLGYIYSGVIDGVAWTATATGTLSTTCTAIASAIDAISTVTATGASETKVVVTAASAGHCATHTSLDRALQIEDVTADPGLAADLTAINQADADWYGMLVDTFGKAEIVVADTWLEANKVGIFPAQTGDYAVIAGTSGNVAKTLKASSAGRTGVIWNQDLDWKLAAGILGQRLTSVPGADTWHLKNVTGPQASDFLTGTQVTNLKTDRVSYYQTLAGFPLLFWGTIAKAGVFFDQVRGRDWFNNTAQINIVAKLSSLEKAPFTDQGIEVVKGAILAAIQQGIKNGYIADDGTASVTAPKAADVDPVDRGNRLLPDVTFTYTESGAIHGVVVQGTVQV